MGGDGDCLRADLAAFIAFFLILFIAAVALSDLPPPDRSTLGLKLKSVSVLTGVFLWPTSISCLKLLGKIIVSKQKGALSVRK